MRSFLFGVVFLLSSLGGYSQSTTVEVDCSSIGQLSAAIEAVRDVERADIFLRGVCRGHFVIDGGVVTLRGVDATSGLAAPLGTTSFAPVLEIRGGQVSLRSMIVEGGLTGVMATGWDSNVLLFDVDVSGQDDVGVSAWRGARLRMIGGSVIDSGVGVSAYDDASVGLSGVTVRDNSIGVSALRESSIGIDNSTIRDSFRYGIWLIEGSTASLLSSTLQNNGQIHAAASSRSSLGLTATQIGTPDDTTTFSLSVSRDSRITSGQTPTIFGSVNVLDKGSLRLGNTKLEGNIFVSLFSDVLLGSVEVSGLIFCQTESRIVCSGVRSDGVIGCLNPYCGRVLPESTEMAPDWDHLERLASDTPPMGLGRSATEQISP